MAPDVAIPSKDELKDALKKELSAELEQKLTTLNGEFQRKIDGLETKLAGKSEKKLWVEILGVIVQAAAVGVGVWVAIIGGNIQKAVAEQNSKAQEAVADISRSAQNEVAALTTSSQNEIAKLTVSSQVAVAEKATAKEYIQMALQVLSQPPNPPQDRPMREWAANLLSSQVTPPLPDLLKKRLIDYKYDPIRAEIEGR